MLSLIAPAKVNFFLEVTGDRPDGYHDLRMLMQSISLADYITLETIAEGVEVQCNHPLVPLDESNLAVRAARMLKARFGGRGVRITIDKRIPIGGGLGGGSGNGAAVLWGLNQLWGLDMTSAELQEMAGQLGSDVPFCLEGGTAIAEGRGEILTGVAGFPTLDMVIAKPKGVSVATGWAYQTFRAQALLKEKIANTQRLWEGLLSADSASAIPPYLYNDLERVVLPSIYPIAQLRTKLVDLGCLGSLMSGSGACVLGICASAEQAEHICQELQGETIEAWVVYACASGVQLA